jgi:hypothetical protein
VSVPRAAATLYGPTPTVTSPRRSPSPPGFAPAPAVASRVSASSSDAWKPPSRARSDATTTQVVPPFRLTWLAMLLLLLLLLPFLLTSPMSPSSLSIPLVTKPSAAKRRTSAKWPKCMSPKPHSHPPPPTHAALEGMGTYPALSTSRSRTPRVVLLACTARATGPAAKASMPAT